MYLLGKASFTFISISLSGGARPRYPACSARRPAPALAAARAPPGQHAQQPREAGRYVHGSAAHPQRHAVPLLPRLGRVPHVAAAADTRARRESLAAVVAARPRLVRPWLLVAHRTHPPAHSAAHASTGRISAAAQARRVMRSRPSCRRRRGSAQPQETQALTPMAPSLPKSSYVHISEPSWFGCASEQIGQRTTTVSTTSCARRGVLVTAATRPCCPAG